MLGHNGFNTIVKHKVMTYYIRLHINTQTHTLLLSCHSGCFKWDFKAAAAYHLVLSPDVFTNNAVEYLGKSMILH